MCVATTDQTSTRQMPPPQSQQPASPNPDQPLDLSCCSRKRRRSQDGQKEKPANSETVSKIINSSPPAVTTLSIPVGLVKPLPAIVTNYEKQTSSTSNTSRKTLRPFKAYPTEGGGWTAVQSNVLQDIDSSITTKLLELSTEEAYQEYREQWRKHNHSKLSRSFTQSMRRDSTCSDSSNGESDEHQQLYTNPRMVRHPNMTPAESKDDTYWERRRKNNEAAKRSRETRRVKEEEMVIRASFLEQDNLKLRVEIAALKSETQRLKLLIYQEVNSSDSGSS